MRIFKRRRLRTPHLAKRQRNVFIFRTMLGVVFIFSVFLGVVTLSEMRSVQIVDIETRGNSVVTDSELVEIAKEELSGKYFWLFPKKNTFIYPKRSIEALALEGFERIESIKVSRDGLKGITITISEYSPHSLWCGFTVGEDEQCYFMNKEGLIYGVAPYFSGNAFFRFYGNGVGENPIGDTFLPNEFEKYVFFVEALRDLDTTPVYLLILDEIDFEVGFVDSSRILVARDSDLIDVIENLRSVIESEDFKKEGDIDYIDLRFGNKVYYKLK